jgi:hypothetical protein
LELGDTKRFPYSVEFQLWEPIQVPITDTGIIQAAQDKLTASRLGEIATTAFGGVKQGSFDIEKTIAVADSVKKMRINLNQEKNDRLLDFTRRANNVGMISMYLPNGTWNDRINNQYAQQSMTQALGRTGAVVENAGSMIKAFNDDGLKAGFENAWDLINGPMGTEIGGAIAAGMGMDGRTVADAGLAAIGYALNPQFEMLYSGTDLREFQFDFTMTPRSAKEASVIRDIIGKFKYHGSPQYVTGQGRYIIPPSYFDITFKFNGSDSDWLPRISTCVLKAFDVDYSGGLDQWGAHADGSPIQVRMTMTFVELEMMHKALRSEGY